MVSLAQAPAAVGCLDRAGGCFPRVWEYRLRAPNGRAEMMAHQLRFLAQPLPNEVPGLMHRRRVLGDRITYVGLDVHKDGIVVAVAEGGLRGEVRDYGRIANTPAALQRLVRKL